MWHFTILFAAAAAASAAVMPLAGPCIICKPTKRPLRTILRMHSTNNSKEKERERDIDLKHPLLGQDAISFVRLPVAGCLLPAVASAFDFHFGNFHIYLLKMLL